MSIDIRELQRRLKNDFPRSKPNEQKVTEVECSHCQRRKAYMFWDKPIGLKCGSSHCYQITYIKDLYPDLCDPERHSPTDEEPNRPAKVFLQNRGLTSATINSMEASGKFHHRKNARNLGAGAILFPVTKVDGKETFNGRLYMTPPGEDKGHNIGSTSGGLWLPPSIDPSLPIYCTEGVIDAMSLIQEGYQALSYLSAQNRPNYSTLFAKYPSLKFILSPDNDAAGKASVKRQKKQLEEAGYESSQVEVIAPPHGQDWNDLLIQGKLKSHLESKRPKQEGALLQASSAQSWAEIKLRVDGHVPKVYAFEGTTFGATVTAKKNSEGEKVSKVSTRMILGAVPSIHETIIEEVGGEKTFGYRLEIKEPKKKTFFIGLRAEDLAGPRELRKAMLKRGNLVYQPGYHHEAFVSWLMGGKDRRIVRELPHHGRDPETGAFLMQNYGVLGNRVIKPDADGAFNIKGEHVLPRKSKRAPIDIISCSQKELYHLIVQCFGDNGRLAISWVAASWMKTTFMQRYGFFPFMSLYGEASTGKSTLSQMMSRMRGLDFEGHPLNKDLATPKGMQRTLSQYCDTHITLVEGKAGHLSIDMDIFLSAFNDCDIYLRAQCTQGNETHSDPFKGSIMFVQNVELFVGEPQKSRAVSLPFEQSHHSPESIQLFQRLERIPPGAFASLGVAIMIKLESIQEAWFSEYDRILPELKVRFKNQRIAQTHACVLSAYRTIFNKALDWDAHEVGPYVEALALRKQEDCDRLENAVVQVFIEKVIEYIDRHGESAPIKLTTEKGQPAIAVSNKIWDDASFKMPEREKSGILSSLKQTGYYLNSKPVRFKSSDQSERAWILKRKPFSDFGLKMGL